MCKTFPTYIVYHDNPCSKIQIRVVSCDIAVRRNVQVRLKKLLFTNIVQSNKANII